MVSVVFDCPKCGNVVDTYFESMDDAWEVDCLSDVNGEECDYVAQYNPEMQRWE